MAFFALPMPAITAVIWQLTIHLLELHAKDHFSRLNGPCEEVILFCNQNCIELISSSFGCASNIFYR